MKCPSCGDRLSATVLADSDSTMKLELTPDGNSMFQAAVLGGILENAGELFREVGTIFPGESRHDTAKRYIREHETPCAGCRGDSETHICHTQCADATRRGQS